MSIIERALQRMKHEAAAAPPERAKTVDRPVGPEAEPLADKPAHPDSETAIRPVPCRSGRTVRIDLSQLRADSVIPPEQEERRLADEYRLVKRLLLKAMTGHDALARGNIVVVTSALPGEGKTFTVVNLALSLALERNREVILIDGDVAKRHVTQLFGLDEEPGLLDAGSAAGLNLEDVILRTDIPSLYLLPAGSHDVEATEILGSERIDSLLTYLASEPRRILVIDAPPLLLTSEAGAVAALAGQVLMVVKASATPQEVVVRAIEAIPEGKKLSLLLNQADTVAGHRYGYYGGYAYGDAYNKAAVESPPRGDAG